VNALVLAAGDTANGLRLNIGTGVQTSDRELHTLVARVLGAPDTPSFAPARAGDLRRSALDWTLARERLGWQPGHDLTDGIARTARSLTG
jgi:UDP-glucose 4-epimerase